MIDPSTVPTEITRLSATEIAGLVASGGLSVCEAVEAHIKRIEAVNPRLNAVVVPLYESARAEAAALDSARAQGEAVGPLGGVPLTVKESFDVAGTPTTMGLTKCASHRASADGVLVARLRQAGAVLLGKTNVPLLMKGNETSNPLYGRSNNPWNLDRTPGGSSGGEAAILAAGGSALGLGTDYGGSLRLPAHACGVHALKPTSGRLTMRGHARFRFGQEAIFSQPGPMARSVADLILAMRVLGASGQEAIDASVPPVTFADPAGVKLKGLRVAYYTDNGIMTPAPALRRAVIEAAAALGQRGADIEEWRPPGADEAWEIHLRLICADGLASYRKALGRSQANFAFRRSLWMAALPGFVRDAIRVSCELAGQHRLAQRLGRRGRVSIEEYFQLVEQRVQYRSRFLSALDAGRFDAVLCPPDALPATTHGKSFLVGDGQSYAGLYNLLGMPAGVVAATRVRHMEESDRPAGRDLARRAAREIEKGSTGLPVGVQVVARFWREDIVLAVMAALEDHFRRQPDYPTHPPI